MPTKNNLKRPRPASSSKAIPAPKRQRVGNRRQAKILEAMAKKTPSSEDAVDFKDIKAWIAEQEASPTPVPLTELQRRAIIDLKNSIKASTEPKAEDLLGDTDWVSLLHRYRDAHAQLGVSVEFNELSVSGPPWVVHCMIQSSIRDEDGQPMNRRFPDRDFGFMPIPPDGVACEPPFARKKDAKQYAAKCCVDFLMNKGLMPTDGINVSFPKPTLKVPAPRATKRKAISQSFGISDGNRLITNASSSSSNISTHTPPYAMNDATQATIARPIKVEEVEAVGGDEPVDVHNGYISAVVRVREMCERLGIQPPRYYIEQADNSTNYNGSVEFGIDIQVPETVGRVVNCSGNTFTKEKVAEGVLKFLFQVESKRNSAADELLQAMVIREVDDDL